MPDISLTDSEHEYLKALIMHNRVDGMSYHAKRLRESDYLMDEARRERFQDLEKRVFNKIYKGWGSE